MHVDIFRKKQANKKPVRHNTHPVSTFSELLLHPNACKKFKRP